VDREFISGASTIVFRVERELAQDNHVAFKKESIVLLTGETPPIDGGDQLPDTDELEEAALIQPGTCTGSLGEENEEGRRDNYDYYSIEVEEGQLITLQLTIPASASYGISLLTPTTHYNRGSVLIQGGIKTLNYVADSTGTWYIKINRNYGEGDYQLAIDIQNQNDAASGQDAGKSVQEAIPLSSGTITGFLKAGDNYDYYSIDLEEGQQITLQLTIPASASYGISLLTPTTHYNRGSVTTQGGMKTLDYVADSTGTWYIKIYRSSGEGEYQLLVNTSGNDTEEQDNNPPVINSLNASQNSVEVNQTVTILCSATDQDIETFTFRWSVNGEIIEEESSSLSWIAPNIVGNYTISCTVIDSKGGEDSESVSITVTDDSGGTGSSCSYSFSSYDSHFPSAGGSEEFTIIPSNSDFQWTAVSDVSWIQIDSGGSGPGNQTLCYSVENNNSDEERTGHINIENETYTITQEPEAILAFPQPNGESIPFLNSCRGACGSGCPDTAKSLPDITIRVADPLNDTSHYLLTYTEVTECGTHAACRWHDACFDQCKLCGEDSDFGPLHDLCSAAVVDRYGPVDGGSWALGNGPYDGYFIFANELDQEGPLPGSIHSFTEANYRIDIDTAFFPGAGTDANVYITLFGTDGSSSTETLLDNSGMNDFEMGMHDTFYVRLKNFEDINRIRLRHDNSFSISGNITIDDIIPGSISLDDFIPGSITLDDIIPGNISLDDLIPGSFSLDDLIPSSISSISGFFSDILSLVDLDLSSFSLDDLTPGSISLDDIIPGSISLDDLTPGSITIDDLTPGNITLDDIIPGSISLDDLTPGSITIDDLIPGSFSIDDIIPGNFLAGWYVNEVRIINQDTGQLWHFITKRWLAEDEGDGRIDVEFPLSYKDERDYQIEVYTGDLYLKIGEGTDANIYIALFGNNGFNTGEIFLNYPIQNNFETGAHDTFYYIRTGNVGELNHITLHSDNSGIGSDWYCEKIDIKEVKQGAYGEWYIPGIPIPSNWESDTERVWVIPVNNWLTEDNPTRTCHPQ
jgi:hypothetical protein